MIWTIGNICYAFVYLLCRVYGMCIRDAFGLVYRTQLCQLNVAKSQNGTVPALYIIILYYFQHTFFVCLWTSDICFVFLHDRKWSFGFLFYHWVEGTTIS